MYHLGVSDLRQAFKIKVLARRHPLKRPKRGLSVSKETRFLPRPIRSACVLKKLIAVALSASLVFAAPAVNAEEKKSPYWQCVTFARSITGMQIFGDAWTWWEKATGKYEKGNAPKSGAVLVFQPQGKMSRGHVAVVSQVVTERIIQITHANWSPINGTRGQVEKDVTVVDVSEKGDWSRVKVWYGPLKDVGSTVYPTYGFIYQAAQTGQDLGQSLVAQVLDGKKPDGPVPYQTIATKVKAPEVSANAVDAAAEKPVVKTASKAKSDAKKAKAKS